MSHHPPIVIVVDDDPSVCRALARLLRSFGLTPVTFGSAAELLSDPRRLQAACFLFDVQMPVMTGFELVRCLAAEGITTPVIFITAHPEITDAQMRAVRDHTLLTKPFDDRDLVAALRDAIGSDFDPATP